MLVAGDRWGEGALMQQKGISGALLQGDVPSRISTFSGLTKCGSASPDMSSTAMSVLEMGCEQSFHGSLKASVLGPIPEVGRPSRAVPLGGQWGGRGSCRHRVCLAEQMCPWREPWDRETE